MTEGNHFPDQDRLIIIHTIAEMVTAVTGDIGAGKSTAAKLLAHNLSCEYLNADVTAKSMWLREDVKARAVSRWGNDILASSGEIILPELASLIFSDESNHSFVNSLIHPPVMSELEELSRKYDDAVVEIPLLFEAGHHEWIDVIVYVTADFETRTHRCKLQRGWGIDELMRRERFLLPCEKKIAMSDYVIHNDKKISELEEEINRLGEKLHERK